MTAPTEAQTTVTSSDNVASLLLKFDAKLKHSASHTPEINNARRRSGASVPARDWQAGFQSHV